MSFIHLNEKLKNFELSLRIAIRTIVVDGSTDRVTLDPIFDDLKTNFEKLDDITAAQRVIMTNRIDMEKFVQKLEDRTISIYTSYLDTVIRNILNFPRTEKVSWTKWVQNCVAFRFLHFLQGITMFQTRDGPVDIGRPAYHRITSCGEWVRGQDPIVSKNFEQKNLTCNPDLAPKELERTRRNVWTCLIERLIYDEIYKRYVGQQQNTRHMANEERVIRDLFESCFTLMNIDVKDLQVFFDTNDIPIYLRITYETNKYKIVETYTKETTDDRYTIPVMVHGKKEVFPTVSGPGDEYRKIQSYFSEPTDWLPISPGAPPGFRFGGGRGGSRKKTTSATWKPNCIVIDPWV